MTPDPQQQRELSELEKSGVIMSRMLHELTNHLSVLVGGLQLIDSCKDDPELAAASMEAVRDAGKTIGEIVERYASFHRQVPYEAGAIQISEIVQEVQSGLSEFNQSEGSDWNVVPPTALSLEAQIQARWVRYAVLEVVRQSHSKAGQVLFYSPGMAFDGRGLRQPVILPTTRTFLHIEVNWVSEKPVFQEIDLFKPTDLSIATLIGIVRWARGQVSYAHLAPNQSRFWISLPLSNPV